MAKKGISKEAGLGIGILVVLGVILGVYLFSGDSLVIEAVEGCGVGTVLPENELVCWQKSVGPNDLKSWGEVNDYCSGLELAGHDDWRLPTRTELEGIIMSGASPSIDETVFTDTEKLQYWTSSPYIQKEGFYWYIHFNNGFPNFAPEGFDNYGVRCIRDVKTIL